MPRREIIGIVGAGLVGPVIALYLARRGAEVHLYERGPSPLAGPPEGGRSVHLVVSARGFRALAGIGLDGAVREAAIPLSGRAIHPPAGPLRFQPYGRDDQAIYAVQRSQLNRILATAAASHPGITARFDQRCLDVDPHALTLDFLDTATGERSRARCDVLLGADGCFSRVRAALMRTDRFDYSQQYMAYGYREIRIPPAADGSYALSSNAMHVWPRKRLMVSAFPNPDRSFTAMLVMPFEGEVSFAAIATEKELRALFEAQFADLLPLVPEFAGELFQRPPSSLVTIRCSPWVFEGRVALIGDAAHAMVPFFGQGMNAGLEDCVVLDGCLERHGGDWARALPEYQALRRPDCDAVTDMSLQNFVELSESVGDPRFLLKKRLEQRIHGLYPERFIPLYPMVAFGHLPYAEVQRIARAQEDVLQRLLAGDDDLEARWESPDVDLAIHRAMQGFEPAAAAGTALERPSP
jgi:kynurenine 3-monooxygenase